MTQQPSQNKQILQKLDEIVSELGKVKEDIAVVKEQIKSRPEVDKAIHKAVDDRIEQTERRIKQLEDNQRWIIIAIFGAIINAIMQLVLH
jgi:DNA repair exonuclease SbcCD ATPase subunit